MNSALGLCISYAHTLRHIPDIASRKRNRVAGPPKTHTLPTHARTFRVISTLIMKLKHKIRPFPVLEFGGKNTMPYDGIWYIAMVYRRDLPFIPVSGVMSE